MVRVLPDVAALNRTFDYSVPDAWHINGRARELIVGTVVRVNLHGRRVRGWVTECDPPDAFAEKELSPVAKITGAGPSEEVLQLARWATRRWAGAWCFFVGSGTPQRAVSLDAVQHSNRNRNNRNKGGDASTNEVSQAGSNRDSGKVNHSAGEDAEPSGEQERLFDLPAEEPSLSDVKPQASGDYDYDSCFNYPVSIIRTPPAAERWPLVQGALRRGCPLFVVPTLTEAVRLTARLRRSGHRAALLPDDWTAAAAGDAAVVGTRSAVFGPAPNLGCVVIFDEHDENLASERSPTWHAREVAVERARRRGVPCVLASPLPSLEALAAVSPGAIFALSPQLEKNGWPALEIVDLRDGRLRGLGLLTPALTKGLAKAKMPVCVLNRKGRARLLDCAHCRELVRCEECSASLREITKDKLTCGRCGEERPRLCSFCGSMRLRTIRPGIAKLAEELEKLIRRPVVESSGEEQSALRAGTVLIGTEAVLRTLRTADFVAFLDFDQELTAPRFRANQQAAALLARAARLVGRSPSGGNQLVQTRLVDHVVIRSAAEGAPDILTQHDQDLRRRLNLPPFGSLAEISGPAAEEFVQRLGSPSGVEISEVEEGKKWIARSASPELLPDALSKVARPKGRMRLAVDPQRL